MSVSSSYLDLPRRLMRLDDIDYQDSRFKISKNRINEKLSRSVKTWGVIDDPVLLAGKPLYTILQGHNRLSILKNYGEHYATCRITEEFNLDLFIKSATIKHFHGDLGPGGKIKLLLMACELSPDRSGELAQMVSSEFGIPDYFSRDIDAMKRFLNLPQNLADYSDTRDIPFKTLREIILLPSDAIEILSNWVECINFRVNIFRDIVEILFDLSKRDGSLDRIRNVDFLAPGDPRVKEIHVLDILKEQRYPEYSKRKKLADSLIGKMRGKGVNVDFPPYFEGDMIGISIKVLKREGDVEINRKIEQLDRQIIRNLLDLL